jgi:hypothetical protein
MRASRPWRLYFEANAQNLLRIPWERGAELTEEERADVAKSIQEFQAGESSEGKHLFRYACEYAAETGDEDYVAAVRLFIAEEQRHGRDLGRFLTLHDVPLVATTFTDRVFRRLRNLWGGLEVSISVLILAELIAKVYYAALRRATRSEILQRLCEQILRDEVKHVEFQAQQLAVLRARHGAVLRWLIRRAHAFLYLGTCLVVCLFHRRVFRRGGVRLGRYWSDCWMEFSQAVTPAAEASTECAGPVVEPIP